MNKLIYMARRVSVALMICTLFVGCKPNEDIPEEELVNIFHDAFLANAYLSRNSISESDSLLIYEPILKKYGYTVEEFREAVMTLSQRKSARISELITKASDRLDEEATNERRRLVILDTIDNVAYRRFKRVLYSDKDVVVDRDADSSHLRITVPVLEPGYYIVKGSYTLDSLDREPSRRMRIYFEREDESEQELLNGTLLRRKEAIFDQEYTVGLNDSITTSLVVDLFHYSREPKRRKMPRMVIHNIEISHTPHTEQGVDMLFNEQSYMRIFSDSLIRAIEAQAKQVEE